MRTIIIGLTIAIVVLLAALLWSPREPSRPYLSSLEYLSHFEESAARQDDPNIEITSKSDFIDEPITVRLTDLAAGQKVGLSASSIDANNVEFVSRAVFRADDNGIVDTSSQAPIAGTYVSVDSSGLLWSMSAINGESYAHSFKWDVRDVDINVTLSANKTITRRLRRHYPWPKTIQVPIELDGYVGDLWLPHSDDKVPLILFLGGFDSATKPMAASLLAARGFAVLDLVYHGQPPLPDALERIPLEYAVDAIQWAADHPNVDGSRVGVFGISKGAEYALLLASHYPEINAVTVWTPSSVAWAGINFRTPFTGSSWTHNGYDVPFISGNVGIAAVWRGLKFALRQPVKLLGAYSAGLEDENAVRAATIPVEKIAGPILIASGSDDQMWPAQRMGEMIVERLDQNEFVHPYRHRNFENVGHSFLWNQWPSGPLNSGGFIRGGEFEASQAAGREIWFETIAFFKDAFSVDE